LPKTRLINIFSSLISKLQGPTGCCCCCSCCGGGAATAAGAGAAGVLLLPLLKRPEMPAPTTWPTADPTATPPAVAAICKLVIKRLSLCFQEVLQKGGVGEGTPFTQLGDYLYTFNKYSRNVNLVIQSDVNTQPVSKQLAFKSR
jgi:hypothetical protein